MQSGPVCMYEWRGRISKVYLSAFSKTERRLAVSKNRAPSETAFVTSRRFDQGLAIGCNFQGSPNLGASLMHHLLPMKDFTPFPILNVDNEVVFFYSQGRVLRVSEKGKRSCPNRVRVDGDGCNILGRMSGLFTAL